MTHTFATGIDVLTFDIIDTHKILAPILPQGTNFVFDKKRASCLYCSGTAVLCESG